MAQQRLFRTFLALATWNNLLIERLRVFLSRRINPRWARLGFPKNVLA